MSCTDLCTAAKCAELEARIGALEQALSLLEASFNAHTNQEIPTAHSYTPNFSLSLSRTDNDLSAELQIENRTTISTISLGESEPPTVEVIAEPGFDGWGHYELVVTVNGVSGFANLQIAYPPVEFVLDHEYNSIANQLKLNITGQNYYQDLYTETIINLNEWELGGEHVPSNLSVDLTYADDFLTVTVADGESSAAAGTTINAGGDTYVTENHYHSGGGDTHIPSNLTLTGSFENDYLTLNVADGESSATAQILMDMNIDECCDALTQLINGVSNQVSLVENYLTIDISGEANSDYQCVEPSAENSDLSDFTLTPYTGIGLAGLHENLKLINTNLDAIFATTCATQAIDVVTILPSANTVTNLDDKVLVLHFVSLDNYPKRKRGSDYRSVQIPGAFDRYDWSTDFADLLWTKGNQYGELELNEYEAKVSGWFKDKTAGEIYFDRVLTLTRGTEKNRRYPDIKHKRTNIVETIERPYRAFIEDVLPTGKGVCLAKYVPPINE